MTEHRFPSPARAWFAVTVFLIATALSFVDRSILSLLVTPIKAELQISDTEMSFLIGGGFAIFYMLAGLPIGHMADRMNRKHLLIIGMILWSVSAALGGLASSYAILFLTRIGLGIGEATVNPCTYSMIADSFPREKLSRAMSVALIGGPIGAGLALVGGSAWIELVDGIAFTLPGFPVIAGWRLVLVSLLVPSAFVVLLMFTVREPARQRVVREAGSRAGYGELFRFLAKSPGLVSLAIGMAMFFIATQSWFPWLPSLFERRFGIPAQEIGYSLGLINALIGPIGLLAGGFTADWMFRRGRADAHSLLALAACIVSVPVLLSTPFAPNATVALLGLCLQFFLSYFPLVLTSAALQMATPADLRGKMASVNMAVQGLCALFFGPSLVAIANDALFGGGAGLNLALALVGGTFAPLGALIVLFGLPAYRRQLAALVSEGGPAGGKAAYAT